jgi:hypothetical protein
MRYSTLYSFENHLYIPIYGGLHPLHKRRRGLEERSSTLEYIRVGSV